MKRSIVGVMVLLMAIVGVASRVADTEDAEATVTARIESAKRMAPLLVEQLTAPVRFTHAGQALIKEGVHTFVEVGPGNVLSGLIKRIDRSVKTISVSTPEEIDRLEETLLSA